MRTLRLALAALVFAGCLKSSPSHVDGGVLGRVVVYRNGVAFYERRAVVHDGKLTVHVPRDRVDDFLKSLTVVDPVTRKPLSVTIPRKEADDGSYLTMTLETTDVKRAEVLLTYVTEAPAWKPSYRIVVGSGGKVMLEGWAIVDNTTTEDWKGVLVGVGASSALAFRYDLWSVRQIDRDLLAGEEKFAIAPPTGVSPYAEAIGAEELVSLDANEVRTGASAQRSDVKQPAPVEGSGVAFSGSSAKENQYHVDGVNTTGLTYGSISTGVQGVIADSRTGEKLAGVTVVATTKGSKQTETAITDENGAYAISLAPGTYSVTFFYAEIQVERGGVTVAASRVTPVSQKLDSSRAGGETIAITSRAPMINPTSTSQSVRVDGGYTRNIAVPGRAMDSTLGAAPGSMRDRDFGGFDGYRGDSSSSYEAPPPPPPVKQGDEKLQTIADKVIKGRKNIVIEVHGTPGSEAQATARGAAVKNKLVDDGVPATRIHIVPRIGPGEGTQVRVLAVDQPPKPEPATQKVRDLGGDTPVGESHFMADRPMTVRAGTSAMVAIVHGETTGGVVYLYDPISDRGDKRFAFKAVRLDNPTSDTLEPGPVTVYGEGRFIGEGITEPVPPRASVVVPFALDKQVVVESSSSEHDKIAKLVTLQRGVLTAEVQHRRQTKLTVTSRLTQPAKVYLRHRLELGWTLLEHPSSFTRVGDSQLFEIMLAAGETKQVTIAEATPLQRTFQLASDAGLGMMKVFIDEPGASAPLKAQIEAMLATHRTSADLLDKIATLRDQLGEYRARSGELHAQLVTLKAVRTGGELMGSLRAKLAETSDRIQRTTIAVVDAQEQLMLTRVKFQNQLADLRLTDATTKSVTRR
ncbi:MAG: carboxypeptidase regulatory-like domain-containing protein [Deltaproteobacteria bacterium]|nr:carboxypeptidase regulatory-like domain-containing protein [Deltaproteobacteria bacterium]